MRLRRRSVVGCTQRSPERETSRRVEIVRSAELRWGKPRILALFLLTPLLVPGAPALGQPAPKTAAPRLVLVDFTTNKVLFEKNADQPTAPASLVKLMTAEVLLDQVRKGRVSLDDAFTVSEQAGRFTRGSIIALQPGAKVKAGDLLQSMLVASANNAALVIAEGIAGSVPQFAALMNQRAQEIGLTRSRFTNPHGLPDRDQQVTMRDMAVLAAHLIRTYPDHYARFGQANFTFNGVTHRNRNPLLGLGVGADGLKTGQTNEAGYALVASAERKGRRLILAMNGLTSEGARASDARELLEWSFGRARE